MLSIASRVIFCCVVLLTPPVLVAEEASTLSRQSLEQALELAGENRAELNRALTGVPESSKPDMEFLIRNMPVKDLKSLSGDFLIQHVVVANKAREKAAWGSSIPESIFRNNVLPYANVNEKRDDVRKTLHERFWPVVKDLDSASVAAARLNQEVFKQLSVRYSTQRRRADQGPQETMDSGIASCTGLSILLIDACRACGIPARFAGTPLWSDGSGNHSWVEIWDGGWHFTGAAEPTGDELNKGWFTGRASKATRGDMRNGIFAVSFEKTELRFPMVWARNNEEVYAVEVTDRYAAPQKVMTGLIDLRFKAIAGPGANRCQANLLVRNESGDVVFRGLTNDERFDANDHVTAKLKPGKYVVELTTSNGKVVEEIQADEDGQLVTIAVEEEEAAVASPVGQLEAFLSKERSERGEIFDQAFASQPLSKEQAETAKSMLVEDHLDYVRAVRKKEHEEKKIVLDNLTMRYDYTIFGERPEAGHCLVISMHGGGGAPARVNDQQWENQKRLYKIKEGIYLAPRAPTDTWNLWHQGHIDSFFTRIIENFIAFEGIDPNRVYITGYSAGGDGVYQLAPRMADQFAAAGMMAGHPNETSPLGLRNLPFTLHVGGNDSAYSRNKIAENWKKQLGELAEKDPGGYEHFAKVHAGKGHWMDRDETEGIDWMFQFKRNLTPKKVLWLQDDVVHNRFYWLSVEPENAKGRSQIVATREGNKITLEKSDAKQLAVLLNDQMVDLSLPIKVYQGDELLVEAAAVRTIATLASTLYDRGDAAAMFSAKLAIEIPDTE